MSTYYINNQYIHRKWEFNNNKLYTISIKDVVNNLEYVKEPILDNDFSYEGLTHETFRGYKNNPYIFQLEKVEKKKFNSNIYTAGGEKLIFTLYDEYHGLKIDYIAILYKDAPAIKTYLEIEAFNMPEWYFFDKRFNVIDTYPVDISEYKIISYEFFTRTDHTNYLIKKRENVIGFDKGNIIFANNNKSGLFFLKESPVYNDCRPECHGQFFISKKFINTIGTGIMPHEFKQEKMKTYSSVIGVYSDSKNRHIALKKYQEKTSHLKPMILVNPWGSRKWMEHINEKFVIEEITKASTIGAEYYQLDDGWNEGNGLIHVGYSKKMDKEFWDIKKGIFPNKFSEIKEVANKNNIELALWIGLDCNCMYRNYKEQADIIYNMYINYDIKVFKIDIMKLRSYESEENIEKLFKLLREKSKGEIIFNLDVTADKRSGYFMFNEYGVIFLENRYEDIVNKKSNSYAPYLTLKNQWDLANFVPLQNLQIEFLNINSSGYEKDYLIAVTLFSNPLCWFESSTLDNEAINIFKNIIEIYKIHRDKIQKGYILSIGNRPNNESHTGFISYNTDEKYAYLLLFREDTKISKYMYRIDLLNDKIITKTEYIINKTNSIINIVNNNLTVQSKQSKSYILAKIEWE